MMQAFVITLREGLEAFLIVAISLAYLRKSGRQELVSAVRWGIALSVVISIVAAVLFRLAANQALWEGLLAIAAAVSVATLTIHMWRTARRIKGDIEGQLRSSTLKRGAAAFLGVLGFTTLMISREGMETALLLLQLLPTLNLVAGALLGIGGAAVVAWLWSRFGHRVNLALFLQTTAIFLFVFVVQLSIQGVHEMSEQSYLPYSQPIHEATEAWGPDSTFGHALTYLMVLLPLGWLAIKGSVPKPSLPKASFPTTSATR